MEFQMEKWMVRPYSCSSFGCLLASVISFFVAVCFLSSCFVFLYGPDSISPAYLMLWNARLVSYWNIEVSVVAI